MSKSPLRECEESFLALHTSWLALQDSILRIYRSAFIAKNHTEPEVVLDHMAAQHSRALTQYHLLSVLTGYDLCPECRGEKSVTYYGDVSVSQLPCPVCGQEGIVKR